METLKCIQTRKSIRKFTAEPVDRKTVEELVAVSSQIPSWKNAQPTRYTLVENGAVRDKIAADLVPDFNGRIIRNCQALLAVSALKKRSAYERDGTASTIFGDGYQFFDCGIAVQTLCLAAWDRGLGSVVIGVFDPVAIRDILSIPEEQDVIAMVALGVPDGETPVVKKKGVEALLRCV